VETDASIFRLGRSSAGAAAPLFPEPALNQPGVRCFSGDGRAFVRRHRGTYDAILLHLPGPENAQLNRFFTSEFFREAREALRPGGIISFLLPSSPNYLGAEQLALERSIAAALRGSFPSITVLPGESHLYMAGEKPANLDLEPILSARGIVTGRLLDYDWPELSDPFRRDELSSLLFDADTLRNPDAPGLRPEPLPPLGAHRPAPANRDLAPAAFRHFLDLRARLDAGGRKLVQAIIAASILAALLACVPGRSVPASTGGERAMAPGGGRRASILCAVATSGFASMALELAVLLLFQVIFGNLYLRLSLLVALFLAGGSLGALGSPRLAWSARTQLRLADAAVVAAALVLLIVGRLGTAEPAPRTLGPGAADVVRWIAGHLLLPATALLAAVPMGIQFAAAGRAAASTELSLGRLYLADLAGAACGTMVTGLWLLPRGGIPAVIAAVVAIKAASLVMQLPSASTGRAASPTWRTG
jgi:spermidine synthase